MYLPRFEILLLKPDIVLFSLCCGAEAVSDYFDPLCIVIFVFLQDHATLVIGAEREHPLPAHLTDSLVPCVHLVNTAPQVTGSSSLNKQSASSCFSATIVLMPEMYQVAGGPHFPQIVVLIIIIIQR